MLCLSSPDCDAPRAALAHVVQALADWRLGQYAEGFTELGWAQERINPVFKNGLSLNPNNDPAHNWFDWVSARILLRECQEQVLQTDRSLAPAALPPPSLASAADYRALGEWHALRQEWRDAAAWFGALLTADRLDDWDVATLDYLARGAVLGETGDKTRYESFREEAIGRSKGTEIQPAGLKHGRWDRSLWFDWVFARVLLREASQLLSATRGSAL
jgi:hypothetical protein